MPESVEVCSGIRSGFARLGRRPLPAFVAAALLAAVAVIADPYPPYWDERYRSLDPLRPGGVARRRSVYIAYTRIGTNIADKRDTDGSNGGTSPQGYVNVSSGCTDEAQPSVHYAYDGGQPADVLPVARAGAAAQLRHRSERRQLLLVGVRGAPRCGRCSWTPTATATAISPCISTAAAARLRGPSIASRASGAAAAQPVARLPERSRHPPAAAQPRGVRGRPVRHRSRSQLPQLADPPTPAGRTAAAKPRGTTARRARRC